VGAGEAARAQRRAEVLGDPARVAHR
jgi:hypothetical protein